jgi:hypothetical protein
MVLASGLVMVGMGTVIVHLAERGVPHVAAGIEKLEEDRVAVPADQTVLGGEGLQ